MTTALPGMLERLFRIQGEPTPPPGDPAEVRTFRAGRNYYWYKLLGWGIGQLAALAAMTYANIQQISVRRGPLQQLLGIGDVEVRTAGGGEAEGKGKN